VKKVLICLAVTSFLAMTSLTNFVLAQNPPPGNYKPVDLNTNNLLNRPDFGGIPCYDEWEIEVVGVACNVGAEYVWLNHNNSAGDPAVKQTLTNLIPGIEYEILVGWRGGDHGPIHGVTGQQSVFAIDIDGVEEYRLTTGPSFTNWMINNTLATEVTYDKLTFIAEKDTHTIRFRGEVGLDGDVLIDWVQVKLTAHTCEGFETPMDIYPVTVKGNRALPLKAELFDADGYPIANTDIDAAPVLQVMFQPVTGGDPIDVTGEALPAGLGTVGNQFVFTGDLKWHYNLKTRDYTAAGTYEISIVSGDETEYVIEPACVTSFVRE